MEVTLWNAEPTSKRSDCAVAAMLYGDPGHMDQLHVGALGDS